MEARFSTGKELGAIDGLGKPLARLAKQVKEV